ncbi:hypothetical protein MGAD_27060 [Mycolicibacterium gadium]|uniref:Uncharacterized protein n=1 Tax=Mycolicibacterium gadium TaxID=1794 RepID=A0A7I7WP98_MYCGU|nr:hypothetical protein MGAD_27060 [Mycolicibacterium gadium]
MHERRLTHSGNPAEQGAFAPCAGGRIDGGSELAEFLLSVDHPTVEVEQWSGHGGGHTVARAVLETAR